MPIIKPSTSDLVAESLSLMRVVFLVRSRRCLSWRCCRPPPRTTLLGRGNARRQHSTCLQLDPPPRDRSHVQHHMLCDITAKRIQPKSTVMQDASFADVGCVVPESPTLPVVRLTVKWDQTAWNTTHVQRTSNRSWLCAGSQESLQGRRNYPRAQP